MMNWYFSSSLSPPPPYMPYLTLWDKISQNLAHLEGNSHKKFWSHRIFRPFYNRFYEEININHTLLWFSQASHMKKVDLRLYCGKTKVMFKKISQNFVKSPLVFCLISQILVHSLWHECTSPPHPTPPENRLWHFMHVVSLGSNLHEMSRPIFWKNISEYHLLKFLSSMLSISRVKVRV